MDPRPPLCELPGAAPNRGRGIGTYATRWILDHLFTIYPELHRIEATTSDDNAAMRRVLSKSGLTQEGTLRDAWWSEGGTWFDTVVDGVLRSDWAGDALRS